MNLAIRALIEAGNLDTKQYKGDWIKVHETEPFMDTKNMTFRPFKITASKLCGGDFNQPIKVEFFNYKSNGSHTYKGELVFTINSIQNLNQKQYQFIDKRKDWKPKGTLIVNFLTIEPNYSFSEYLRGGMNISAVVCIDFTASNGDPMSPNSLHANSPNQCNEYQSAILAVMNI